VTDYKELVRRLRGQAKQDGYTECEAADALEKLEAEVERYRESDLSEAVKRLDETKDAEIERLTKERDEAESLNAYIADRLNEEVRQAGSRPQVEHFTSMDEFRAALRGLGDRMLHVRQERDEALAARETYAMTARKDIIEKAKALDELEKWTGVSDQRAATTCCASVRQVSLVEHVATPDTIETLEWCGEGPTLAAAIRNALEKASGQRGE